MEMSNIITKQFRENNVRILGDAENPLFCAKDVCTILGLENNRRALMTIPLKYREWHIVTSGGQRRKLNFLTEAGLYKLILKSQKKEAEEFQDWLCEEVIPAIRKTGHYSQNKKVIINTEADLQKRVARFIRQFHPEALFTATLGENQDTQEKRLNSYQMGYQKGVPDLLILNHNPEHKGLAIELKTPTGEGQESSSQTKWINKLQQENWKMIVSNNYEKIIMDIHDYFEKKIYVKRYRCQGCNKTFKDVLRKNTHYNKYHL